MKTTYKERVQKVVSFPVTLYQLANNKAQNLGLSFGEYIKFLLVSDVKKSKKPILPVGRQVSRLEKITKEALEESKRGEVEIIDTPAKLETSFEQMWKEAQ
ncbi:MAG TPA: hypothetical protein VJB63_01860 [Patescibacteria group bacterium]|nr:hypothetical protein [Patescibacteria group bacterium]